MRDGAAELSSAWRQRGHDLHVGIGIAQGKATIGAIGLSGSAGTTARSGNLVTCLPVRLCGEAQAGPDPDDVARLEYGGRARGSRGPRGCPARGDRRARRSPLRLASSGGIGARSEIDELTARTRRISERGDSVRACVLGVERGAMDG